MMKKKCFYLGLLTCLAAVSSCSLESYEMPVEETYTEEFIKTFGLIDSNQDWNMVTRASVTVTTETAAEIKVYGLTDGSYRLMGDFADVQGTQLLQFDTPEGVTDLRVSNGTYAYNATVGGEVSFAKPAATRTIITDNGNGNSEGVKVEETTEHMYFYDNSDTDYTGVYQYRKILPEKNCNISKVTHNFKFTNNRSEETSFLIYPVYWFTENTITIGICYKVDGQCVHVPAYAIKSGEELIGLTYVNENSVSESDFKPYYAEITGKSIDNTNTLENAIAEVNNNESYSSQMGVKCAIEDYEHRWTLQSNGTILCKNYKGEALPSTENESAQDKYDGYRSTAIKVTVPANLEFQFYLTESKKGHIFHSNSAENETATDGTHIPHVGTFLNNESLRCICFEDWYGKYDENNPDLNDFIIYTTLKYPSTEITDLDETEAQTYIIAAEDLGNTDDYDFNDMVIKVSTPIVNSNSTDATNAYMAQVTALAAGGTLPLRLMWTRPNATEPEILTSPKNESDQFHSWFGDGNISSSTMINTTSNDKTGSTYTLYLSDTEKDAFSMASFDGTAKMGGFTFEVTRSDGEYSEIKAPNNGTAPQMICVPDTWKWPTERTNISTAYPGFGEWGANYKDGTWINNVVGPVIE